MKKRLFFCGLTLLFSLSAVSGLFSGNVAGAVGCLLIAAIFGFLAYRSFKNSDSAISATAGVKSANNTTPPGKFRQFSNSSYFCFFYSYLCA